MMWRPAQVKVRKHASGTATIRRDNYSSGTTGWWTVSGEVRKRSGGKCEALVQGVRCNKPARDVHHMRPLTKGGVTTKSNLIHLCDDCHKRRHSHMR